MWRLRNRYALGSELINQFNVFANLSKSGWFQTRKDKMQLPLISTRTSTNNRSTTCETTENKLSTIKVYLQEDIKRASLADNKQILNLVFGEHESLPFPLLWLRDNCQCSSCFDQISKSRIHDQQLTRRDLKAGEISVRENGLSITWSDGHVSIFSKDWLCRHSFREEHRKERWAESHIDKITWTNIDFHDKVHSERFKFSEILNDDHVLLSWLVQLAAKGVAILKCAPKSSGELEKIAQRVAFIRKTHYGEEFMIKGSDDANNVAYKKGALQLHTDLPYYFYMPGIVMLHCVKPSSEGGENILTDGFKAASQLPREMFKVLSETIVDWVDIGSHDNKKFHSRNSEPVLCLNNSGTLEKINWSQPQRDSIFNVSVEKAVEWYDAAIEFTKIIHHKDNAVVIKSEPGDILSFDNRRILHGRTDYRDTERLLYGAYIDWDEIYSRIRVLKNKLNA